MMDGDSLADLRRLTDRLVEPGRLWCEPGTVLMVEDDLDCRRVLEHVLARAGYEVYQAKSYEEATHVALHRPAAALIDLRLPGGANGLEVGRMLRRSSPGTRCVMLTAYSTESAAIDAVNLGFVGYFQKPYDIPDLLALLQDVLGEDEAR